MKIRSFVLLVVLSLVVLSVISVSAYADTVYVPSPSELPDGWSLTEEDAQEVVALEPISCAGPYKVGGGTWYVVCVFGSEESRPLDQEELDQRPHHISPTATAPIGPRTTLVGFASAQQSVVTARKRGPLVHHSPPTVVGY